MSPAKRTKKSRAQKPRAQISRVNKSSRSQARVHELRQALDRLNDALDLDARVAADPIRFPKRFDRPLDQEVISLFSALLAYGRVSAIGVAIEELLTRVGDQPAQTAVLDAKRWRERGVLTSRFEGFVYRFTRGADLTKLWIGVGQVISDQGSLGAVMRAGLSEEDSSLINAYQHLYDRILSGSEGIPAQRGFAHLLSDPRRKSALKRINMWLRWLVRGPDAVDLGLWRDLDPARLVLPLDVHTFRLSSALGFTARKTANLKVALEVTERLRDLCPSDPISYDFALAHLGISGACRGYRVTEICGECPLDSLCTLPKRSREER